MTFDDFRHTARVVLTVGDNDEGPRLVYLDGSLCIEFNIGAHAERGPFCLTIANDSVCSFDLVSLERVLFEYAKAEGFI